MRRDNEGGSHRGIKAARWKARRHQGTEATEATRWAGGNEERHRGITAGRHEGGSKIRNEVGGVAYSIRYCRAILR